MQLTKNFNLKEFTCKDGTDVPAQFIKNVQELANNLQIIRDEIKLPIKINSGYRSPKHNKKIGGKAYSMHLFACASDISVNNLSSKELYIIICRLIREKKIKDGGLAVYPTFVHYDVRNYSARW